MKTLERNEKMRKNQGGILTKLLISLLIIAQEYCVSLCAFFVKSCKHTFSCRKIYSVEEKRCLHFFLAIVRQRDVTKTRTHFWLIKRLGN